MPRQQGRDLVSDVLSGRCFAVFHPETRLEAQVILEVLSAHGFNWFSPMAGRAGLLDQCVRQGIVTGANKKLLFGPESLPVLRAVDLPLTTAQMFSLLAELQSEMARRIEEKLDRILRILDPKPVAKSLRRLGHSSDPGPK